jgi:hypothetical protein
MPQELCLDFYLPTYSFIACCCQSYRSDSHHQSTKDDGVWESVETILHSSRTDEGTKNGTTNQLRERLYDYSSAHGLAVMRRDVQRACPTMVPPNRISVAVFVASGACKLTKAPPAIPMMMTRMIQETIVSQASQTNDIIVIKAAENKVTL